MKKYLLNYFLVGAAALLTVVGLQSFDRAAETEKASSAMQQDCTDELIWFEVKQGVGRLCSNYEAIDASELTLHPAATLNPLLDMAGFTYNQAGALEEIDCPTGPTFTCAVGYAADASNFAEIDDEWVPLNAPVCTICRVTQ